MCLNLDGNKIFVLIIVGKVTVEGNGYVVDVMKYNYFSLLVIFYLVSCRK